MLLKMAPIDRSYTTLYRPAVITKALSCTIFESASPCAIRRCKILPKSSVLCLGCNNVTDRRQTDDRQTDGRLMPQAERNVT